MRVTILLALSLLLSGCLGIETGLGRRVQVPALPENLAEKAGPLQPNTDKSLAGQIRDNNNTIRAYNNVASQNNTLIDLYNCVRESINNKKEPKCL